MLVARKKVADMVQVKEMSISDLIPYENNPRKNDGAVNAVAASIREFGFRIPIIIDKNNVIVAGHTRLKAALQLKLTKVPVIQADDLTDEQIAELRIADNKTIELSDWDFDLMKEELEQIRGIDMKEFGFLMQDIQDARKEHEEKGTGSGSEEPGQILCPRCGAVVEVID